MNLTMSLNLSLRPLLKLIVKTRNSLGITAPSRSFTNCGKAQKKKSIIITNELKKVVKRAETELWKNERKCKQIEKESVKTLKELDSTKDKFVKK